MLVWLYRGPLFVPTRQKHVPRIIEHPVFARPAFDYGAVETVRTLVQNVPQLTVDAAGRSNPFLP